MKIISWNVNGIRACLENDFLDFFYKQQADIFCIQETKVQVNQVELKLDNYKQYWNYSKKKGYSGTAVFTKKQPIEIYYGIKNDELDTEGRAITLEFDDFYLINVYIPNSESNLKRFNYRMEFDDYFREYANKLNNKKNVIICGDMNVVHNEIDSQNNENILKDSKQEFLKEEKEQFERLLQDGYIDTFRHFNPNSKKFTWWSGRYNGAKGTNAKRMDYFLVSDVLTKKIYKADIIEEILSSDHCPIILEFQI